MVTLIYTGAFNKYRGLSADPKPSTINGSEFHEMDSGKTFYYNADGGWIDNSITKKVASMVIKTAPTKTSYTDEEEFDLTGCVATVTYSDTTTADKAATYLSAPKALFEGQTSVLISYIENGLRVSASQAITVTAAE